MKGEKATKCVQQFLTCRLSLLVDSIAVLLTLNIP